MEIISKKAYTIKHAILLLLLIVFTVTFLYYFPQSVKAQTTNNPRLLPAQQTSIRNMLAYTKEINYYPSANGWDYMWSNWNASQINSDFSKISSMGFNTVRIILQADSSSFSYPNPSSNSLNELNQVITIANAHNLKVHLTLFDWWSDYSDITGSKTWANAIITPFAGDSRISIIELQNEIDPSTSQMSWAQAMIPYLQSIDGGLPVTISEYGSDRMQQLVTALNSTPPDFYTYHEYNANDSIYNDLKQVVNIVNGLPLFIGETGYPTYPQYSNTPYGMDQETISQESYQEYYYRAMAYATEGLGLPIATPWIFSDFTNTAIPGGSSNEQYYFGLYRTDGSSKPAVATIQNLLAGSILDLSFNNGFESVDGNGLPTLWRIYQNSSLNFTANFSRDTTTSHSGNASVKIWNSVSSGYGTPQFFLTPIQYINPNETVTLSGYMKGQNVTGVNNIEINWYDSSDNYLYSSTSSNLPTGNSNWQNYSVTVTVPSNAAIYNIGLESGDNTGSVWFDDISFNTNPPPTPSVQSAPTDTYLSTINLSGIKNTSVTKIFVNSVEGSIVDSTDWNYGSLPLSLGNNSITIYGENTYGSVSPLSTTDIKRHLLGDINGDVVVNLTDFSIFAVDWGHSGVGILNTLSDMNNDGIVNLQDLSIFSYQYNQ